MRKELLAGAAMLLLLGAGCSPAYKPTPEPSNPNIGKIDEQTGEETIDISGRGLTKVPASIFGRINAVSLNISKNKLTGAIPAEIRKLSKLRILNMSGNKLTGIPAEVGQLSDLEVLDVSNNQITGLPLEIGNLKNLKVLVLNGNNYSKTDLEQIREQIPDAQIVD